MLAEELDFHQIFKIHPTAMALLTADLEFVDANEEMLAIARRSLQDLVGRNFFEVFPRVPDDPGGDPKWTAVEAAMTSGRREGSQLIRYDVEDPEHPGAFEERYWSCLVQPIRGSDGDVAVIECSILDITPVISQYSAMLAELEQADE
jgi:PAS domain-containing protein